MNSTKDKPYITGVIYVIPSENGRIEVSREEALLYVEKKFEQSKKALAVTSTSKVQ